MYKSGFMTVLQIFGTYFIFYFIIGFFIAKYVRHAKIILDKIELVAKELKNLKTNNTSISEKIKADKDKLTIRKYLYTANFAVVNGKSEVAPYLALSEIPDANLKLLDTIQKSMSPQVAKSLYGKRLTQWIKERREIEK